MAEERDKDFREREKDVEGGRTKRQVNVEKKEQAK